MPKFPALETAQGELDAARKSLRDVFAESGPDYDMSKVKSISGDNVEKVAWIKSKNSEIEQKAARVAELIEMSGMAEANQKEFFEKGDIETPGTTDASALSLGSAFVKSRAFKDYRGGQGPSARLENIGTKNLFAASTAGDGWDPETTRSGKVLLSAQRPSQHVVNFIPATTINQTAYIYMEETTFNAVLPAGSGTDDSSGLPQEISEAEEYTEAQLVLTERSKTVEKLAVWLPITDEQLEDVDGAEAYVNQRLTTMMQLRVDRQILIGNGSTPNLLGTESVSGIETRAKGTDSVPDAAYKLLTSIRSTAFAEPNVMFIHPTKWQDVVLMKTADGQYIWGHPSAVGPTTLWGVPVAPTTVVTSTKLVMGDYATHSLLGLKRGIEMQVTNAHSDFFIKGKQAVRADMRLVMVHFRPGAFGTVTGL